MLLLFCPSPVSMKSSDESPPVPWPGRNTVYNLLSSKILQKISDMLRKHMMHTTHWGGDGILVYGYFLCGSEGLF